MKTSHIIGSVIDTLIKILMIVVAVMFTYKYSMLAYDFGYRIFAEGAVSTQSSARVFSISVSEDATVMEIGELLQEKGLIKDANLFYVQEYLSGHHGEIKPGIYELNSAMTSIEMIELMCMENADQEE